MFHSCSVTEGESHENDKKKMVPCVKEEYVDLSYFPNTPDMDGISTSKVYNNVSLGDYLCQKVLWNLLTSIVLKNMFPTEI